MLMTPEGTVTTEISGFLGRPGCQVMALLPSESFNFLADGWDESKEEPADLEKLGAAPACLECGVKRCRKSEIKIRVFSCIHICIDMY